MNRKPLFGRLLARFKTINAQLSFTYTVLIVVVVASIISALVALFNTFSRQSNEIYLNSLEITGESVENRINTLRRLVPLVREDPVLKTALREGETAETSEAAQQRMDFLYAYGLQHRYLITTGGRVLDPVYSQNAEQSENMLKLAGYYEFLASGKDEMFSAPHQFPFPSPEGERISYFYRLRDVSGYYEEDGYLLLIVSIQSLFDERRDFIDSHFDDFYVVDGEGRMIYSLRGGEADTGTREYVAQNHAALSRQDAITVHGSNLYFHQAVASYPDWQMVGVVANSAFTRGLSATMVMVSLFGVLGIVLVLLFSHAISNSVAKPVTRLNASMAQFESGQIPEKLRVETSSGEMAALVAGFNHMLDNIEAHMDTIVREQEEKKTAEVAALQYQLQSLQNQINPHFLYNTLNIISFLALDGKSDEIRSFNQSLISLLRATLSNTQDTVTVSHELSFLEAYVQIMEYRYPDLFRVEVKAAPDTLDWQIPKLILQPLVENAMLHGILPAGRAGVIRVGLYCQGGWLCVAVQDDGVGMDDEQLEGLLSPRKGFTSIGLNNVNDRLLLCYGPQSGLSITSQKQKGTLVAFKIPRLDGPPKGESGETV